jgi:adenylate cyclase
MHKQTQTVIETVVKREIYQNLLRSNLKRLILSIALASIIIVAAIVGYPKILNQITIEKLRSSGEKISIAVIPFQNMTNDTTWDVWQDGIQYMLITYLSNYPEELVVPRRGSIKAYIQSKDLTDHASITPAVTSTISKKLEAIVFVCGSIIQDGATIRVNAQLTDSKTKSNEKDYSVCSIINDLSGRLYN